MNTRAGVVAWLAAMVPAWAQEPATARAFVEIEVSADQVYLHQACELRVLVGIDAEWFAAAAVPLFQQRLDQPFQVLVPWLRGAEDRAVGMRPPPPGVRTQRLAVGDAVVEAEVAPAREVGGRRHDVFVLRYRWLPLATGVSAIAPVELRYAFATQFEDDFLRGRQPVDRQERSVLSPARSLQVRALPIAGRPPEFTGAVGEFVVTASTNVRAVQVGETFDVEVVVTGDGNLQRMAPLPPPALPGFHVQGVRELRRGDGRTFGLAVLALRAGANELPPIGLVAFSPATGVYVRHRSEPVPLRVVAAPAGTVLPPAIAELVRADEAITRADRPSAWWPRALVFVAVLLALLTGQRMRRRSRQRQQIERAADAVAAAFDRGPAAAAAAFEHLLTLAAVQVPAESLAAANAVRARLDAARFGGVMPDRADLVASVAALVGAARRNQGAAPRLP